MKPTSMKPRGVLCEFLVDVCRREILTLSAAHTLKAYKWEYPPGLEVFAFISNNIKYLPANRVFMSFL